MPRAESETVGQDDLAFMLQDADDRHADRHQGGLRIFGQLQVFGRAVEHHFA